MTGSGPHAGDADARRNGLDPQTISQVHADLVFLLVGLASGCGSRRGPPAPCAPAAGVLILVELGQGLVGFVQYFTDLPEMLVAAHMLGACLVWLATLAALSSMGRSTRVVVAPSVWRRTSLRRSPANRGRSAARSAPTPTRTPFWVSAAVRPGDSARRSRRWAGAQERCRCSWVGRSGWTDCYRDSDRRDIDRHRSLLGRMWSMSSRSQPFSTATPALTHASRAMSVPARTGRPRRRPPRQARCAHRSRPTYSMTAVAPP